MAATPQFPLTRNLRDDQLTIMDLSGTNNQILALCEGNLKVTEPKNVIEVKERGALSHRRPGDAEYLDVSLSVKFKRFGGYATAHGPELPEILKKIGKASAWVTTATDGGGVFMLDLMLIIASPIASQAAEILYLRRCDVRNMSFSEGNEYNTFEYSGKADSWSWEPSSTT